MSGRISGIIFVKADGVQYKAKGSWTYNLGQPKREMIVGSDGPHGYKELPQAASLSGVITDQGDLDVATLLNLTEVDLVLQLANGKSVAFDRGTFTADGDITTEEAEIQVEFMAEKAKEI